VPKPLPVVGGNWKMNTDSRTARSLADAVAERVNSEKLAGRCEVAIFPPFVYLQGVHQVLRDRSSPVLLGARTSPTSPTARSPGRSP
jgi:triosephosphate isomerase